MSLEAKRITNMPPITGYLVVGLIMAQSIPHWVIDRPVAVIHGGRYWLPPWCWFIQKKILWHCFPVCYRFALAMPVYCYCNRLAISCLSRWLRLLPHAIALPILSVGGLEGQNYGRKLVQVKPFLAASLGWLRQWVNPLLLADVIGFADQLDALILGLGLGILAQAGDLLESAIKRWSNIKDSGSILPGHGGMLDRFDGYILAIPAFYIYLF